ncbi:hypothetical protein MMC13_000292 [Lambiella insularis]|nr:hypothetical protein [Lambiella insularis]
MGKVFHNNQIHQQSCQPDLEALRHLNLTPTIQYGRSSMVVEFVKEKLNFTERLNHLSPEFQSLDLSYEEENQGHPSSPHSDCAAPIKLKVPLVNTSATDASHLIFGVATSVERLNASVSHLQHWLAHTNARLIALLEPHPNSTMLEKTMQDLGINVTFKYSNKAFMERWYDLTRLLLAERTPTTQWAGIVDDDTFFLSMAELVSRLAQHDHREEKWIGGLTEDFTQMGVIGYIAYGGAGMFISMPLLARLDEWYDECSASSLDYSDGRLAECISKHTTTKLTWEHDLYQTDLWGDVSGFYEAGRKQPLSVHHWKTWYQLDMTKLSAVSAICGDACLLKRWRFLDGWYLVNGYSFIKYGQETVDEQAMEMTWWRNEGTTDSDFSHSLMPLRPKDEQKVSFKMEDIVVEDGVAKQFYVHRPGNGLEDRVLEIIWTRR